MNEEDLYAVEVMDESEGVVYMFAASSRQDLDDEVAIWEKYGVESYIDVRPITDEDRTLAALDLSDDEDESEGKENKPKSLGGIPPQVVKQYLGSAE